MRCPWRALPNARLFIWSTVPQLADTFEIAAGMGFPRLFVAHGLGQDVARPSRPRGHRPRLHQSTRAAALFQARQSGGPDARQASAFDLSRGEAQAFAQAGLLPHHDQRIHWRPGRARTLRAKSMRTITCRAILLRGATKPISDAAEPESGEITDPAFSGQLDHPPDLQPSRGWTTPLV